MLLYTHRVPIWKISFRFLVVLQGPLVLRLFSFPRRLTSFILLHPFFQFVRPGSRRPFFYSRLDDRRCSISVIHSFHPHSIQLESTQRRGFSEIARVGIWDYPSLGSIPAESPSLTFIAASRYPRILEPTTCTGMRTTTMRAMWRN